MEIKRNILKKALRGDKVQYGIWNGIPDGYVAEILAGAGFDWILIDGEHGPFDLRSIISQLQAMAPYDVSPVVRPPSGDPVVIKQLLDAGVQSLVVPMVESKEQAEDLVRAMHYPPAGIRGVGTALARASQWKRVTDYFDEAGKEMCLIVQVESVRGMDALDDILEVEGVDGVFIGPADLAGSMGHLGDPMHPEVVEQVSRAMVKIRKAGKAAGTLGVREDIEEKYVQAGANMLGLGVDLILLARATRELVERRK